MKASGTSRCPLVSGTQAPMILQQRPLLGQGCSSRMAAAGRSTLGTTLSPQFLLPGVLLCPYFCYGLSGIPAAPSSPSSSDCFIHRCLNKCVKMSPLDIWGRTGGEPRGSAPRLSSGLLSLVILYSLRLSGLILSNHSFPWSNDSQLHGYTPGYWAFLNVS